MPTQDTGVMFVRTIASANISFAAMEDRQRAVVDKRSWQDPAVSGLISWIGEGNGGALSIGQMLVALKPPERAQTDDPAGDRRGCASAWPRSTASGLFFVPLQDLNLGAQSGRLALPVHAWGIDGEQVHARRAKRCIGACSASCRR